MSKRNGEPPRASRTSTGVERNGIPSRAFSASTPYLQPTTNRKGLESRFPARNDNHYPRPRISRMVAVGKVAAAQPYMPRHLAAGPDTAVSVLCQHLTMCFSKAPAPRKSVAKMSRAALNRGALSGCAAQLRLPTSGLSPWVHRLANEALAALALASAASSRDSDLAAASPRLS